ncbi:monovalent cation:proton antiporter-2 (CPA2) family protein [Cochlodiniinecator piscidefendens]|uniref:monovalent cation:proton antiporter-2 (CPA2) family protein n=1 Tax=Cochlodiniinecator piscidefendens TaxID=2715756 RepID=UPI001408076D|nr:monovalent cation:proton antiporter-2 (CPA2) family protein [Cochlodiniinecator piscidefendens]
MESFLFQASVFLLAAVIAVPIASRLGLGSVLGYLLAGIIIGPVLGLMAGDASEIQHFAEFGVVMMLFLIGLELDPRALWAMRMRLIGLGGLQIGLSAVLLFYGASYFGMSTPVAMAIGLIFSLSSTAIVLQTLSEKGLMQTAGGRSTFSVLLSQDIAVIPMLAFLPLLSVADLSRFGLEPIDEHHSMSLVEGLPGWGVTLVTLGAVGGIVLAGIYLTRPLFKFIHSANLREMYTAFALLIVIGIAFLMTLVGLSPALGTFLAGVVLANSEFRHELESDIEPFKGLLLGLFFITVGAGINFSLLFAQPFTLLGLTLAVMLIKGTVLFAIGLIFKLRKRDHWLFTLGLAQAGEFGFVLIAFSQQQRILPPIIAEKLLLIVALSMLITPLFFILYDLLSKRMKETQADDRADEIDEQASVIIAGVGRFGQVVNRMVQLAGKNTVVLDTNLEAIELMRKFGFKGFLGDPTRPELLRAAGIMDASVLVVAIDNRASAISLVAYARRLRPDLHIVARAYDRVHTYELYRAGANDIVREMFDGSLRAGRYVLENAGLSEFEAHQHEKAFFKLDRYALRELAVLWDPEKDVTENEAFMERAHELNAELETAIGEELSHTSNEKITPSER